MSRRDWLQNYISTRASAGTTNAQQPARKASSQYAPSNIALIKYWGKRDIEFNLPTHSSLSISLAEHGARCSLRVVESEDKLLINNEKISATRPIAARVWDFINECLNVVDATQRVKLSVNFELTVPLAAGLASSACVFASLILAINDLYAWNLSAEDLSPIARIGSGSACRSLFSGFVEWNKGVDDCGADSAAQRLDLHWPEFRIALCMIDSKPKLISSRDAMQQTMQTSPLFAAYSDYSEQVQLANLRAAVLAKDFSTLGAIAEQNALSMHATMQSALPAITYTTAATQAARHKVWQLRRDGVQVYMTQDAGPNLKLLFLEKDTGLVKEVFANCSVVIPFS